MAIVALAGCSLERTDQSSREPLSTLIQSNGYVPFEIPRENWGPGTVLSFVDGHERMLAFDSECFALARNGLIGSTDSGSLAGSFPVDPNDSLDRSLSRKFREGVDVSAALQDSRVRSVNYAFAGEHADDVSTRLLENRLQKLNEDMREDCVSEISSGNAIVIERVLGVESIEYTFSDENGTFLPADAAILGLVGLTGDSASGFAGAEALSSRRPMQLGYRAVQFKSREGSDDSRLQVIGLSTEEIEQLRADSR